MTTAAGELAPLFAAHRELRAVIDAVVEGRQGTATADGAAARLSLGCYEIFGGDSASPGARRLVAGAARPRELVYGNDPAWRRLILDVHGAQVFDRPMRDFDASGLDRASLLSVESALPAGFTLERMGPARAAQLDSELEPHGLQVFPTPDALAADGIGFAAVAREDLACAATSYAQSSRLVEVAIATRPRYRGRGLAASVAAAFLRYTLDAGLVPCWSASNPVSQRLAERLGYRPATVCEVLFLRPGA